MECSAALLMRSADSQRMLCVDMAQEAIVILGCQQFLAGQVGVAVADATGMNFGQIALHPGIVAGMFAPAEYFIGPSTDRK